jgi:molecular chaperone HscB
MNASGCWKCGQEPHDSLFCKFCNTLQPPSADYYRFFGLDRRLNINAADLQRRYYSLSRLVHPDRYPNGTHNEKRFALDATAILNDAYRTLRDPAARAEYVLKDEGIEATDRRSSRVPPELIEDVFEVNMSLEQWRHGDHSVRPELEAALSRFRSLREDADSELGASFTEYDSGRDRNTLIHIRHVLDRRSYISNLIGEMEERLSE